MGISQDTNRSTRLEHALKRAYEQDALGHCLLFVGAQEEERRRTVERCIRMLLCASGLSHPCGACTSCRASLDLHPDYVLCAPAEDARSLSVEDVGRITHFATLSSSCGGYRVAAIFKAERLTTQAANALLKLLEEPPNRFVCMLSAHAASRVLPTIRSRAAIFRLSETAATNHESVSISEALAGLMRATDLKDLSCAIDQTHYAIAETLRSFHEIQRSGVMPPTFSWLLNLSRALDRASTLTRASVNPRLTAEWVGSVVLPMKETV